VYPNPYWAAGYKGKRMCGVYRPTNVVVIPYSPAEASWPDAYLKRQCNEFLKLSLRGITVVAPSGDTGVSGGGGCNGYPAKAKRFDQAIFRPLTPATCPYVLAVGATTWNRANPAAPPQSYEKFNESAWWSLPGPNFFSGGGFSNLFGVPSYQRQAIDQYDDEVGNLPFGKYHHFVENRQFWEIERGLYHHGGRAYPDVSAIGDRQLIYISGVWLTFGGTDVAANVWAALVTLLNEARIAKGKSTVGFIQPVLVSRPSYRWPVIIDSATVLIRLPPWQYAHPEAFNDITVGSNPGCGTQGFPAAKGWDPVTGLG
jgi:tripeptidyl-peptidase I